jgi:hypothetical protein
MLNVKPLLKIMQFIAIRRKDETTLSILSYFGENMKVIFD